MANKRVSLDEAAFAADCALGMYSQEELAAKYGVSKSTVGKMVRGQRRPEVGALIVEARKHACERARQRVAELLVRAVDVVGGLMNSDRPSVALAAAKELLNRGLGRHGGPVPEEDAGVREEEQKELRWLRWRARVLDGWLSGLSDDTVRRVKRDLGISQEEIKEVRDPQWNPSRRVGESEAEEDDDWDDLDELDEGDEDDDEDEQHEAEEQGESKEQAADAKLDYHSDDGQSRAGGESSAGADAGANSRKDGRQPASGSAGMANGDRHRGGGQRAASDPGPGGMNAERRRRMAAAFGNPPR